MSHCTLNTHSDSAVFFWKATECEHGQETKVKPTEMKEKPVALGDIEMDAGRKVRVLTFWL